jgi:hypothetical protein
MEKHFTSKSVRFLDFTCCALHDCKILAFLPFCACVTVTALWVSLCVSPIWCFGFRRAGLLSTPPTLLWNQCTGNNVDCEWILLCFDRFSMKNYRIQIFSWYITWNCNHFTRDWTWYNIFFFLFSLIFASLIVYFSISLDRDEFRFFDVLLSLFSEGLVVFVDLRKFLSILFFRLGVTVST